jgi:hypothetical protein
MQGVWQAASKHVAGSIEACVILQAHINMCVCVASRGDRGSAQQHHDLLRRVERRASLPQLLQWYACNMPATCLQHACNMPATCLSSSNGIAWRNELKAAPSCRRRRLEACPCHVEGVAMAWQWREMAWEGMRSHAIRCLLRGANARRLLPCIRGIRCLSCPILRIKQQL